MREKARKRLSAVIFRAMRNELNSILQKQKMKIGLTPAERFERIIFHMLHPDPKKRITAKIAHKAMIRVLSSRTK